MDAVHGRFPEPERLQVFLFAALAIYAFISATKVGADEKPHYRANYFSGLVMTGRTIRTEMTCSEGSMNR